MLRFGALARVRSGAVLLYRPTHPWVPTRAYSSLSMVNILLPVPSLVLPGDLGGDDYLVLLLLQTPFHGVPCCSSLRVLCGANSPVSRDFSTVLATGTRTLMNINFGE